MTALMEANAVIEEHERVKLTCRDRRLVLELLENPPGPNAQLQKVARCQDPQGGKLTNEAVRLIELERTMSATRSRPNQVWHVMLGFGMLCVITLVVLEAWVIAFVFEAPKTDIVIACIGFAIVGGIIGYRQRPKWRGFIAGAAMGAIVGPFAYLGFWMTIFGRIAAQLMGGP